MDKPSREKRFSEKEVAAILRRAIQIQGAQDNAVAPAGSSPNEIIEVGEELGLSEDSVRRAIEEFSSHGGGGKGIFGVPVAYELDRTVPFEIGDEAWQELVMDLRKTFARVGSVSAVGSAREWTGGERDLDEIHVSVQSKEGRSRIRFASDLSGALFLTAIVSGLALIMAVVGLLQVREWAWEIRGLAAAAALGAFLIGFRGFFGWMAKRRRNAVSALGERLEGMLSPRAGSDAPALATSELERAELELGTNSD